MDNIFGTKEELKLYDENKTLRYEFYTGNDGFLKEIIYDKRGEKKSFNSSNGYWGKYAGGS